ncbi:uncharacterized protein FN964_014588 [Alca torda]
MAAAEELREEANCSVCLDLFCTSVVLGCGHTLTPTGVLVGGETEPTFRPLVSSKLADLLLSPPPLRVREVGGERLSPAVGQLGQTHDNRIQRSCKKTVKKGFGGKVGQAAGIRHRAGSDKSSVQRCFTHDQSLLYPFLPVPPRFLPSPLPLRAPSSLFGHADPCEPLGPAGPEAACARGCLRPTQGTDYFMDAKCMCAWWGAPKGCLFFQEQIQSHLEGLRREKGEREKWEGKERRICQDCLERAKAERQKIVPEEQERQCLEEQECLVLAQLGQLEKQIKTRLRENAAKFSKQTVSRDGLMKECQLSGRESLQVRSAEPSRGDQRRADLWDLPCLWTSDASPFLTYLPWPSL